MLKISLTVLGIFASLLSAFSQLVQEDTAYSTYKKIRLDEVNFVSSYYTQDGDNSAVLGGRGTEKLSDISNLIEFKFLESSGYNKLHQLNIQLGVDAYSSASSDSIDPSTVSSASKSDRRIYSTINYNFRNVERRYTFGGIGYFSTEYDYTSISPGFTFSKLSEDKNREITLRTQVFLDNWKIILPIELRDDPDEQISIDKRNTYNSSLVYSAVVNQRAQMAVLVDLAYQTGLLSTPYHRVFFTDGDVRVERLPESRFKLPIGVRFNYFLGDRYILRSFYRFYYDSWGLFANTLSAEVPIKITPFLSLSPYYRIYNQTAIDYFAPYAQHIPGEEFFTSDYDLSAFTSHLIGLNFRKVSAEGILGIKRWNSVEIRYGYYYRSTGLTAHSIALALRFK